MRSFFHSTSLVAAALVGTLVVGIGSTMLNEQGGGVRSTKSDRLTVTGSPRDGFVAMETGLVETRLGGTLHRRTPIKIDVWNVLQRVLQNVG